MTSETRPLRADAERNRQRILAAAGELFAEAGLHVTLDAVAERAGVGVGTVYRRFPDKEALIDALFEARIDEVGALAEQALAMDDAWAALVFFFDRAIAMHGEDRALKELVFSTAHGRDRVAQARGKLKPIVSQIVTRAHDAGELRPDIDITDIPLIQLMLTAVMEYTDDVAPDAWRRYLALVLDGLRTGGAQTTLPAAALTDEELDGAMARGLQSPRR